MESGSTLRMHERGHRELNQFKRVPCWYIDTDLKSLILNISTAVCTFGGGEGGGTFDWELKPNFCLDVLCLCHLLCFFWGGGEAWLWLGAKAHPLPMPCTPLRENKTKLGSLYMGNLTVKSKHKFQSWTWATTSGHCVCAQNLYT